MFDFNDKSMPSLTDMIPILDELKGGDCVIFEPAFSYGDYSYRHHRRSARKIFRGTVSRMTEASLFVRADSGEHRGSEFRFRIKPRKYGTKFEQVNGRGAQLFPEGHKLAERALAKDIERHERDDRIRDERSGIESFSRQVSWRSSENVEAMVELNVAIRKFRLIMLADNEE